MMRTARLNTTVRSNRNEFLRPSSTRDCSRIRQPESATARIKLRHIAETQKSEIELKPCQNVSDYQLKQ